MVVSKNKFVTGQVTLELCFALFMVVFLFWAGAKVFMWINNSLVGRQHYYEKDGYYGRVSAGSNYRATETIQVNEKLLGLDFFTK